MREASGRAPFYLERRASLPPYSSIHVIKESSSSYSEPLSANIKEEDYDTVDKLIDETVRDYRRPKAKKR